MVKSNKNHLKTNLGAFAFALATLLAFVNVCLNIAGQLEYLLDEPATLIGMLLGSSLPIIALLATTAIFFLKLDNIIAALPVGLLWFLSLITCFSTLANLVALVEYIDYYSELQLAYTIAAILAVLWLTGAEFFLTISIILHATKKGNKTVKMIVSGIAILSAALYAIFNLANWAFQIASVEVDGYYYTDAAFASPQAIVSVLYSGVLALGIILAAIWFMNPYKKGCTPAEIAAKEAAEAEAAAAEAETAEAAFAEAEATYTETVADEEPVKEEHSKEEPVKEEPAKEEPAKEEPAPDKTAAFKKFATPIWQHVLLLFLLGNIWGALWVYRTTELLNMNNSTQRDPMICALLYLFIPYYYIFWNYKAAEKVDTLAKENGKTSDLAMISLILSIFIPIVAPMLIQDKINELAGEK